MNSTEPSIRLAAFAGVFVLMATWEVFAPRRAHGVARASRWPGNFGLIALDTVALRLLFPAAAVGAALFANKRGWGLLNSVDLPPWLEIVIAFVALDLVIYAQHVLSHRVPVLWRLHRVHHSDVTLDITTGIRFHPIEILLSMAIKIAAVLALGASATAVLLFEIVLNAATMFNHANARLPLRADALLRRVLVTPDMHRVHHSTDRAETDSNFGFALPWWDRMFGTYRAQPAAGHVAMTIGVANLRDPREARLDRMLSQPFRRAGAEEAVYD